MSPTNLSAPPAPRAGSDLIVGAQRCGYCPRMVVFAHTYLDGHSLCFDAVPVPRELDPNKEGWLPGNFPINGRPRLVFAPLRHHPADKRRRAAHVMLLHVCAGQQERAFWGAA